MEHFEKIKEGVKHVVDQKQQFLEVYAGGNDNASVCRKLEDIALEKMLGGVNVVARKAPILEPVFFRGVIP